jgi:hypothetical protein
MKVLLIGSGGREHALGWKLATSPRVRELVSLPGNPGLAGLGPLIEGIEPTDAGAVAAVIPAQRPESIRKRICNSLYGLSAKLRRLAALELAEDGTCIREVLSALDVNRRRRRYTSRQSSSRKRPVALLADACFGPFDLRIPEVDRQARARPVQLVLHEGFAAFKIGARSFGSGVFGFHVFHQNLERGGRCAGDRAA